MSPDTKTNNSLYSPNKDILYIVMPAYNEAQNIETVVDSWYPFLALTNDGSRMVIADSGSTDTTHTILKTLQQKYPKLEILSDTPKSHGAKLMALYEYSIKKNADFIFQTDSDGQTIPKEFKKFWELRYQYDALIGKRISRGDGRFRMFVEIILCKILRIYFKVIIPDANAPFRLMRTYLVDKYLQELPPQYNLPNVMLTTFFLIYGENIAFLPITFNARQGGKNSINIFKIVKIGLCSLSDFNTFKKITRG